MGVGSSSDLSVPEGGETFILTNPADCIVTRPKLTNSHKPLCLSTLDDSEWKQWHGELQMIVNQFWNEMLPVVAMIFGLVGFVAIMGLRFLAIVFPPLWVQILPPAAGLLSAVVATCLISLRNTGLDVDIDELCEKLTSSLGGRVRVEYRTAWTTCFKPRHARTARIIAFVPRPIVLSLGRAWLQP